MDPNAMGMIPVAGAPPPAAASAADLAHELKIATAAADATAAVRMAAALTLHVKCMEAFFSSRKNTETN